MYTQESASAAPVDVEALLWVIAVLFFGFADVATTGFGVSTAGIVEFSPTVGPYLDQYGMGAVFVLKVVVFAGAYALWRMISPPARLGVPLGLALLGVFVTGWNLSVLFFTAMM